MVFISSNVIVNKTEVLVILAGDVQNCICEFTVALHPYSEMLKR